MSDVSYGIRSNSKYYSRWEVCLFEGNKTEWLSQHTKGLVALLKLISPTLSQGDYYKVMLLQRSQISIREKLKRETK